MKYYLGIDNGGTTTKAGIFTDKGIQVSISSVETKMISTQADFCERDMDEMWEANCFVINDVIKKANIDSKDISAVSLCGHGKGVYLWGKDGKPYGKGILSSDNRAWKYPAKWNENGVADKVFDITFQKILACQAPSLLRWFKEKDNDVAGKIQWIFECKDYVRFKLTNEAKAEITDYSGANLVNLHSGEYDDQLLQLYGINEFRSALPPLCESNSIAGCITKEAAELTGLVEGTPVVAGMFDVDACALAVGTTNEDELCMIAGTWSINEYIRKTPVVNKSIMLNSFYCIPDYFLAEESSATSAGNYEWFIRKILPEFKEKIVNDGYNFYDYVDELIDDVSYKEFCPIFTPFLMGSNVHPNAKASFVGINSSHSRAHIIRAIYEGIAFSHKSHMDKLLNTREKGFSVIRLAGGVANSRVWSQIFADVMGVPVLVSEAKETGILGTVIAASVAIGDFNSIDEATKSMVRIRGKYMPNFDANKFYILKKRFYDLTNNSLNNIWGEIQNYLDRSDDK